MWDDLPAGTVTFLFTDVEGSTKLLHSLGAEGYADALAEHRRVIREACAREGGVEVDTQGDAFFFAFPTRRERSRPLPPLRVRSRPGKCTSGSACTPERRF
jgi:class 3 adenylate cyclase